MRSFGPVMTEIFNFFFGYLTFGPPCISKIKEEINKYIYQGGKS